MRQASTGRTHPTTGWMIWRGAAILCLVLWAGPAGSQQSQPPASTPPPAPRVQQKQEAQPAQKPAPQAQPPSQPQPPPPSRRRGVAERRDPFRSLVAETQVEPGAGGRQLPPGKRGLVVSQLVLKGIVFGSLGKYAIVTMAGKERAFFLRVRDRLYDGVVVEILPDRVVFRERARDLFGRTVERDVVKQLAAEPDTGLTR